MDVWFPKKLLKFRSAMKRRLTLAGLLEVIGRLLLLLVAMIIADRFLRLEAPLRMALWAAMIAAGLYWLTRGVVLKLVSGRWDELNVALFVEQRIDELRGVLATALDFSRRLATAPLCGRTRMMERVVRDVDNKTITTDFREALPRHRLRRAAAFAFVAALVFGGALLVDSNAGFLGVKRAVLPWRPYRWPTLNDLAVSIEGAKKVGENSYIAPIGAKLKVHASARKVPPEKVFVSFKTSGDRRISFSAVPGPDQTCLVELPELTADAELRVAGGDFRSDAISIRAVNRPEIVQLSSRLEFPPYTGKADDSRTGVHLAGEMQTKATLTVRFAEPVARCETDDKKGIELERLDERTFRLKLTITEKRSLRLNAFSPEGFALLKPLKVPVRLLADRPPKFDKLLPGRDLRLTRAATVPIAFRARDDYGIRQVALVYGRGKGLNAQKVLFASSESSSGPKEIEKSYEWPLARMELAPGDRIEYRLEGTDFSIANEGKAGRSHMFHIDIISNRQALDDVLGTFYELLTRLEAIRNYQKSTADLARLQAEQKGERKKLETISRRTEGTSRDLNSVAREIGLLQAQLKTNQLLLTPEYRLFENTRGKLDALTAGAVRDAIEGARKALAAPEQAQLRAALADAEVAVVKGLDDILKKLTRSQSMVEVAGEFSEIAADQRRLAAATEELLKKYLEGKFSAAEEEKADRLKGRQQALLGRTEAALSELDELAGEFFGVDNAAYNTATEAKNALEREGVRGLMQQAASNLSASLFGDASQAQIRAADELARAAQQLATPANSAAAQARAADAPEPAEPENFIPFQYSLQVSLLEVRDKQTVLNNKTEKLSKAPAGRPRTIKIQRLSTEQDDIAIQTEDIIRNLQDQPAAVFRAVLQQVAEDMHASAEFLRGGRADEKVREIQRALLQVLDQLLASMTTAQRNIARPSKADEKADEGGEPEPPAEGETRLLNPINELKMLRLVQLKVIAGTLKSERLESDGKADEAASLRADLCERQNEISRLLGEMINLDFGLYSREAQ